MARIRPEQPTYNAAYYQANRERIRAAQAAYNAANRSQITAKRKGLSPAQLQSILDRQEGKCAVCHDPLLIPQIDHDHTCCPGTRSCGACVRGLLCLSCNHMLGKAHDNPDVLESGAAYIRQFKEIR